MHLDVSYNSFHKCHVDQYINYIDLSYFIANKNVIVTIGNTLFRNKKDNSKQLTK